MFSATFTSIDFETASRRPDSACQLGLVKVQEGRVIDKACWLIRPKPFFFQNSNIRIHGITPEQVEQEPEFDTLWPEIIDKIGDTCLVAHNASFDLRVLIASLRSHNLPVPDMEYTCTRAVARKTWPHHRRYGLKPLSEWLGIRFRHHDALEDAIACAKILLAAGIDQESTSLPDLEKRLRLRRGQAGSWGMKGPTTNQRKIRKVPQPAESPNHLPFLRPVDLNATSRRETSHAKPFTQHPSTGAQPEEIDWQRLMIRLELIRPLAGKGVVLQGKFQSMSESIANQLLSCSGATCHSQVNEQTDLVILGNAKSQSVEKGTTTSVGDQNRSLPSGNEMDCMGVAKSLRSSTLEYRVLNETQFIDLLQSKPDG